MSKEPFHSSQEAAGDRLARPRASGVAGEGQSTKERRIDYETAKRRALEVLCADEPKPTAVIASAIWLDADGSAPRIKGAASRILKRMHREGLARWTCSYDHRGEASDWGWVKTRPTR